MDGYYRLASGGTTTATGQRLDLSDDFFSHSNGLSRMLFSFDIKRTNVDASAAATAGVYSGFWIYYNLYGAMVRPFPPPDAASICVQAMQTLLPLTVIGCI